MKVRVVRVTSQTGWQKPLWYHNQIGKIFDVEDYKRDSIRDSSYWQMIGWNGKFEGEGSNLGEEYWLFKKDCQELSDFDYMIDKELSEICE